MAPWPFSSSSPSSSSSSSSTTTASAGSTTASIASTASPSPSASPTTMQMATGSQSQLLQQERSPQYDPFIYNSAIAITVACPVIALMPPRKFDLFTFGLGVAFFTSAGIVVQQRTGNGLLYHVGRSVPSSRNRERWAYERKQQQQAHESAEQGFGASDGWREERVRGDYTGKLMERVMLERKKAELGAEEAEKWRAGLREEEQEKDQQQRKGRNSDGDDGGMWKKVWMGSEKEDWLEERRRREEEAFAQGKGYGNLIADQIKEVFGFAGASSKEETDKQPKK